MNSALFVLFAAVIAVSQALIVCPAGICNRVDCDNSVVDKCDSNNGYVDPKGGFCGCCPVCISYIKENAFCASLPLLGVPQTSVCAPGFSCNPKTSTCTKN